MKVLTANRISAIAAIPSPSCILYRNSGAMVIQADNTSTTQTVVKVLDASREADVMDVSLATEND